MKNYLLVSETGTFSISYYQHLKKQHTQGINRLHALFPNETISTVICAAQLLCARIQYAGPMAYYSYGFSAMEPYGEEFPGLSQFLYALGNIPDIPDWEHLFAGCAEQFNRNWREFQNTC